ncbi:unnamed protein product [Effrenium voratum]|uniref:Glycosyltransferase n=1 Tax=Effrenium voratum TaxID=2562239 RepID=A0AA36NET4_9DINO|nr:unnamed protein product [Effrenium voratum]CAJ1437381.1 unnamed protein product [Effrenium voratum]
MARVAVFNMEIVGTVNPVLPVVAELVKQGCDVRYYLSKDTFAKDVADLGANVYKFDDFFPRWAELLESKEEAAWLSAHYPEGVPEPSASGVPMRMLYYSLPAGVCLGRRLLETWSSWRPDIVLYNCMLLHPYLAARKLGIPTCSFSTYPGPGTPMHLYALKPQEREAFDQSLAQSPGLRPANEIAKEFFGVDVFESQLLCRFFSPDRNLVFSIPELQGVVEKHQEKRLVSSSFRWVGSTDPELSGREPRVAAEPEAGDEPWLVPAGVKVIVVSLGSMTVDSRWEAPEHVSSTGFVTGRQFSQRLWSELIEFFGHRSDVRVILAVGPKEEAVEMLGELPPNVVARRYLDQVAALSHADVFVTHGGFNSIKEGILLAVPMVVVPFCVDQPTNGEAIERQKAGLCFPDLLATPRGELTAAVERSFCEEFRRRSGELGEALRAAGGAPAAAEACLSLLSERASAGGA